MAGILKWLVKKHESTHQTKVTEPYKTKPTLDCLFTPNNLTQFKCLFFYESLVWSR